MIQSHQTNDCVAFQKQHAESPRLIREALKLLRALAGNDAVKNIILKNGAAQQIDDLINLHKVSHTLPSIECEKLASLFDFFSRLI